MSAAEDVNWLVRFKLAEQQIVGARLTGNTRSDEESYRAAGFENEAKFWEVAFSERMTADAFAVLMGSFFYEPTLQLHTRDLTLRGISSAISQAHSIGESWVSVPDATRPSQFAIDPWQAAKWLASSPKRAHLIPKSLRSFLSQSDQPARPSIGRKRGPTAVKKPMVVEAMRKTDPDQLGSMKLSVMAAQFGAGETLCSDARNFVLAEARNLKLRETPNNEK